MNLQERQAIVHAVVGRLVRHLPASVDAQDLRQEAMARVWALDIEPGRAPEAYIARHARGAVLDHLRAWDHLSRRDRHNLRVLDKVRSRLASSGERVTAGLLAHHLQTSIEEIGRLLTVEALVCEPGASEMQPHAPPDDGLNVAQHLQLLRRAVETLPARERDVIERRLAGQTQTAIAAALGISDSAVSQIKRRAVRRLRVKLGAGPGLDGASRTGGV